MRLFASQLDRSTLTGTGSESVELLIDTQKIIRVTGTFMDIHIIGDGSCEIYFDNSVIRELVVEKAKYINIDNSYINKASVIGGKVRIGKTEINYIDSLNLFDIKGLWIVRLINNEINIGCKNGVLVNINWLKTLVNRINLKAKRADITNCGHINCLELNIVTIKLILDCDGEEMRRNLYEVVSNTKADGTIPDNYNEYVCTFRIQAKELYTYNIGIDTNLELNVETLKNNNRLFKYEDRVIVSGAVSYKIVAAYANGIQDESDEYKIKFNGFANKINKLQVLANGAVWASNNETIRIVDLYADSVPFRNFRNTNRLIIENKIGINGWKWLNDVGKIGVYYGTQACNYLRTRNINIDIIGIPDEEVKKENKLRMMGVHNSKRLIDELHKQYTEQKIKVKIKDYIAVPKEYYKAFRIDEEYNEADYIELFAYEQILLELVLRFKQRYELFNKNKIDKLAKAIYKEYVLHKRFDMIQLNGGLVILLYMNIVLACAYLGDISFSLDSISYKQLMLNRELMKIRAIGSDYIDIENDFNYSDEIKWRLESIIEAMETAWGLGAKIGYDTSLITDGNSFTAYKKEDNNYKRVDFDFKALITKLDKEYDERKLI